MTTRFRPMTDFVKTGNSERVQNNRTIVSKSVIDHFCVSLSKIDSCVEAAALHLKDNLSYHDPIFIKFAVLWSKLISPDFFLIPAYSVLSVSTSYIVIWFDLSLSHLICLQISSYHNWSYPIKSHPIKYYVTLYHLISSVITQSSLIFIDRCHLSLAKFDNGWYELTKLMEVESSMIRSMQVDWDWMRLPRLEGH